MAGKNVAGVIVESNPPKERLEGLKVKTWGVWEKEASTFDWFYDEQEVCYFLAGDVTIKTPEGEVQIKAGDLVTFPQGLKCTWQVNKAVRKHYKFG